ncbi:ABC transporter substrate-binding protein [Zhongshania sp.]|uniref:substrate-binding periplasmic protein n=1 Tax=Zhongshania sp. TaxID=1971902 RepID=UPI001B713886|nr:transporter substrate-binding domain-containing protein [Zhongshania sp.]MBQ0797045.1 transporter substrate-binding domain-containing protein [Zhongshania sp.]
MKSRNRLSLSSAIKNNFLFLFLAVFVSFSARAQDGVVILTDTWEPYINSPGAEQGTAAKLIDILLYYVGVESSWKYFPYEFSFYEVKNGRGLLSYPYFKTQQREGLVLFSEPIFSVTSKVYYNRAFTSAEVALSAYSSKRRIGRVAGYSYGQSIDEEVVSAVVFATEIQALTALFNHDIDVLPMTEGVMNHYLSNNFPLRKQLILAIDDIADTSSLHAIAAKNIQGKAIIKKINHAFKILSAEGIDSIQTTAAAIPDPVDIARLITSEGYPLIIGQSAADGDSIDYYTLPQGSKALVIDWSSKITEPSSTDRIYKNMMDLSKVVLLNGPHVGRELFVRNMHIELLE